MPEPPERRSLRTFLPGGVAVLRIAVEDLLKSSWDELFRQRALEIACAFEGSFRCVGRTDLVALVHTLTLLLEIRPEEIALLGSALPEKMSEVLRLLEEKLESDEESKTG
jgi:hypothetical protein